MRIVRFDSLVPSRWKNGGGETFEIAAFPPGAGMDAFEWRISMAKIAADGPFSVFPGIDRTLALIEGNGVVLDIEGVPVRLAQDDAPFSFAGDAKTSSRLVSGPVTDLNIMSRRGVHSHHARRCKAGPETLAIGNSGLVLVFCVHGSVTISSECQLYEAGRFDTFIGDRPGYCVEANEPSRLIVAEIAGMET